MRFFIIVAYEILVDLSKLLLGVRGRIFIRMILLCKSIVGFLEILGRYSFIDPECL